MIIALPTKLTCNHAFHVEVTLSISCSLCRHGDPSLLGLRHVTSHVLAVVTDHEVCSHGEEVNDCDIAPDYDGDRRDVVCHKVMAAEGTVINTYT